jgi:PAS domain S-box-containing protein
MRGNGFSGPKTAAVPSSVKLLAEASTEPVWALDELGRCVYANGPARARTGPGDNALDRWLTSFDEQDREPVLQALRSSTDALELKLRLRRMNGHSEWCVLSGRRLAAGATWVVVAKRLEETGAISAAQSLADLVHQLPLVIVLLDRAGGRGQVNRKWFDYFGVPLVGDFCPALIDLVHAEDQASMRAIHRQLEGSQPFETQARLRRQDAAWRWNLIRFTPLREADGAQFAWVGTLTDVHDSKMSEQALLSSQERFQKVFANAPMGIAITDHDGRFVASNAAYNDLLGYSAEELAGTRFGELIHPDDRAGNAEWMRVVEAGERPFATIENRYLCRGGDPVWVQKIVFSVDADGKREQIALVTDINQRKRSEMRLERIHGTFYKLIQDSPFGIYVVDADFRVLQVSQGAQQVFAAVQPLIGRDFQEVLRTIWEEPFASEAILRFRHTLDTGEPYRSFNTVERRRDLAQEEAYDWRIERITLPDDRFGVVCYFYDLSERHRYESTLRESEERFRGMADGLPLIVWVHDAQGRLTFVNQTYCEFFGVDCTAAGNDGWQILIHPDDRDAYAQAFARSLASRQPFHGEARVLRQDGQWRWIESWGRPRLSETGEFMGVVGTSADITGRKDAIHALHEAALEDRLRAHLSDVQRLPDDPLAIVESVGRLLAEHLEVSHVSYQRVVPHLNDAITRDPRAPQWVPASILAHVLGDEALAARLCAAQPLAIEDIERGGHALHEYRSSLAAANVHALVVSPYCDGGRTLGALVVVHETPRAWSERELNVIREAAERTGDALARLAAERALRASEGRFRTISDAITGFVYVHTTDSRNTFVNRAYCTFAGREPDGLLENRYADLIHPDDTSAMFTRYAEAACQRRPFEGEFRFRRHDGVWRWHLVRTVPQTTSEGETVEWVGTATDITDLKLAQAALHDKTQQLEALLTSAPLGVAYFGRDYRYAQINEVLADLNGLPIGDHIGRAVDELLPENARTVMPMIDQVFRTGVAVADVEVVGETPREPGVKRFWLTGFYPVRDGAGAVTLVGVWVVEITHIRRAEEALREADRRKNQFLATLAHELRNPLAPIRNAIRILEHPDAPEPVTTRAREMMRRQTDHMVRLVDDLLEVSRITLGKLELRREPLRLVQLIEQAVDAVWTHMERAHHRLTVVPPSPRLRVEADPVRFVQVLVNLLTNACKYTDSGGHIELQATHEGNHAVIHVRDDGIGMAADRLPHVFEMFYQEDTTQARSDGGLGIGLALARGLVQLHGGVLTASSDGPGKGSVFTLRIPALPLHTATGDEPKPPVAWRALAGTRVLVVDDNRDAAVSLASLLRLEGVAARVAYDGASALAEALRECPDIVLLDLGMPERDGYAVCQDLRQAYPVSGLRIYALTGWGQDRDRARTKEAGFDGHLVKPVDMDLLFEVLSQTGRGR